MSADNTKTRRKQRERAVSLLYLMEIGGDFIADDYDEDVIRSVNECEANIETIDAIIVANLKNWTIDRLNYVDKAIIEYAVYEMKYQGLPYEIAINEALELTKKYSNLDDDSARRFNNKLLDTIKAYLMQKS